MKKIRCKHLVLLLLLLALLLVVHAMMQPRMPHEADGTAPDPEGQALQLPAVPLTPATMTEAQKQAAIEAARQDAVAAASASGQTPQQAQTAGDAMAEAARRAMVRPSAVDADAGAH